MAGDWIKMRLDLASDPAVIRLAFLRARGDHGATDEEIATGLAMNPSTARPRRIELVAKGMIVQAGEGKTASGRRAVKNLAKAEKTHAASSRSLFDAEAVA